MKITILGCGTSGGVPRITGDWGRCDPADPRNGRTRPSAMVEADGFRVLIDTTPEVRIQCLAAGVGEIDAVIWTHDHADHTHGIDDLRGFSNRRRQPVPAYAARATLASIRARFGYVFEGGQGYPPLCEPCLLEEASAIGPMALRTVEQPHGFIGSSGLRFEHAGRSFGYAIDFSRITPQMGALYTGVDLLVADCLRHRPHPTHANVMMALELVAKTRPGRTLLSHMDSSMDYQRLFAELPEGVEPAFDGQEIVLA